MLVSRRIPLKIINISNQIIEKIKTYFMFKNVFRKSCRLLDNLEKYGRARQIVDENIKRRMRFVC
jgi:hypothetical protein